MSLRLWRYTADITDVMDRARRLEVRSLMNNRISLLAGTHHRTLYRR
jgi:hypothetical protein